MYTRLFITALENILFPARKAGVRFAAIVILSILSLGRVAAADFSNPLTSIGSDVPVETLAVFCDVNSVADDGSFTIDASYADVASALGITIESNSYYQNNFYMRWFIVDDSDYENGSFVCSEKCTSWTITPTTNDYTWAYGATYFNIFEAGASHQYGIVADCKGQLPDAYDELYGCTYTIPSEDVSNAANYNLVCFISFNGKSSTEYSQPTTDRDINAVVVFNIVTSVEDLPFTKGSTSSITKSNIAEVMTVVDTDTQTASVDAFSHVFNSNENSWLLGLSTCPNYIRWYVEDAETGEVIADNSEPYYLTSSGTYSTSDWSGTYNYNAADYYSHYKGFYMIYSQSGFNYVYTNNYSLTIDTGILGTALDDMKVSYTDGLSKIRVVCLLSTDAPSLAGGYVTREPDFDAKVIFYFKTRNQIDADYPDTAGSAADGAYKNAITKIIVDANGTNDEYAILSDNIGEDNCIKTNGDALDVFSDVEGEISSSTNEIYYMRWVVLDPSGNAVDSKNLFSGLNSTDAISSLGSSHVYYYNESADYHVIFTRDNYQKFTASSLNTLLSSVDMSGFNVNYSLEFYFSKSMAGITTTTDDDGNVTEYIAFSEPDYDIKITYNYIDVKDVATYFTPAASSAQVTLTKTQVVTETEIEAGTITINANTDLGSDISAALNSNNPKYIRWCLLDGEDIVASYAGFAAGDGAGYEWTTYSNGAGQIYTLTGKDGLELSSALDKMSVKLSLTSDDDGSESGAVKRSLVKRLAEATDESFTDYTVAVLLSTSTPQVYYDGTSNTYVINEPNFNVMALYSLMTEKDFEEEFVSNMTAAAATYEYTASVSLADEIEIDAYTDSGNWGNTYGTAYWNLLGTPKYIRWYITDSEGNVVEVDDNNAVFKSTNASGYYQYWGGAYVLTSSALDMSSTSDGSRSSALDDMIVYGSKLQDGYSIVCLVSNDEPTYTEGYITAEPSSFVMKFTYTIVEEEFHHYIGYEFEDLGYTVDESTSNPAYEIVNGGIRQQTNEWTYYRYVKPGETIQLILRLQKVKDNGNDLEPQGYFRWYDYDTDYASEYLSTGSVNSSTYTFGEGLERKFYEDVDGSDVKKYRGLFAYAIPVTTYATVNNYAAVNFTAPDNDSWEETVIACDVSKYVDGIVDDASNPHVVFEHEPTLSIRYKFVVRPVKTIADSLMNALIRTHLPYEDNKFLTMGVNADKAGTGQVRTDCQRTSDYWFYPCNAKTAAYCDDSYNFTKDMFDTATPIQAKRVMWRAYYDDKYYRDLSVVESSFDTQTQIFAHQQELSLSSLSGNNYEWKTIDGDTPTSLTFPVGSAFELIAFAIDGTDTSSPGNMCPIARYVVRFLDAAPILFDSDEFPTYRTIDYLENNYTRQAVVSFDNYEGSTLASPTDVLINGNPYGIDDMSYSAYGYCYPGLYKYNWGYAAGPNIMGNGFMGLSPLHGDYALLKSMNLDGVSTSQSYLTGSDNNTYWYRWWQSGTGGTNLLYDRTYLAYSNKVQNGYMLYIDASDEARPIVSVPFEADLCTGSCLVLSAAVADMTSENTQPQLMFELFGLETDDDGNEIARHPIHKFNTCDFSSLDCNTNAQWYQVYGKVYLQKNAAVENYSDFIVQITNYANGTDGADYCVDDIRFYTQNAKLEVDQTSSVCGGQGAMLKMKIAYNTLAALIDNFSTSDATHYLLMKICNEDGTDYIGIKFPKTGTIYSVLEAKKLEYVIESGSYEIDQDTGFLKLADSCKAVYNTDGTLNTPGYEYAEDGTLYFVFAYNDFNLPAGQSFYISIAGTIYDKAPSDDGVIKTVSQTDAYYYEIDTAKAAALDWGSPTETCSIYSNVFTPAVQSLSLTDNSGALSSLVIPCGETATTAETTINGYINIPTGLGTFVQYPATDTDKLKLDWIVTDTYGYSMLTTKTVEITNGESTTTLTILDALDNALELFRTDCPTATSLSEWTSTAKNYNSGYYDLLEKYIGGSANTDASSTVYGKVYLDEDYKLQVAAGLIKVNSTYYFLAKAYSTGYDSTNGNITTLTVDGVTYELCNDIMLTTLSTTWDSPSLIVGFDDVAYPSDLNGAGTVRIGLDYLDDMKNSGAHLHVPVNSFENSATYSQSNSNTDPKLTVTGNIYLSDTTDPLMTGKIGESVAWFGHNTISEDASQKLIDIVFNDGSTNTTLTFHEGFEYELSIQIYDGENADVTASNTCPGDVYVTLKVVPKYVTWTGAQLNNTNWNNDGNWTRSTREQLYKSDAYQNDVTIFSNDIANYNAQPQTYVPMKFTKVTIPTGSSQWPYLASITYDSNTGIADGLANRDGSAATTYIEYDMMAKVDTVLPSKSCDHDLTSTANIYDCEKFYGNTCDEIYFKPRTQLHYQHYLTYNYAWVEQQLASGEWYILGSPLKDTYAGDMYAPANSTYLGKQQTEAFEPITFNYAAYANTASATETVYNRSTYPIYQRSWDKSVSKEVTPTGDARGEYYDAFIAYNKDVVSTHTDLNEFEGTELRWSHTYNDVTEPYTNGLGYSIRANSKQTTDSALIRLPKSDEKYTYYYYDDYKTTDNQTGTVKKESYGRLATNASDLADGTERTNGVIYAYPEELQSGGDYYLVGNPYMSSITAERFFSRNTAFNSSKYWYMSGGTLVAADVTSSSKIGPMQAFFVKLADGVTAVDSVAYLPSMTLASSSSSSSSTAASSSVKVTVESSNGKSVATVSLDEAYDDDFDDYEDIETLFDTNLSDKPTLYTVAGSQTVTYNRTSVIDCIPLGVVEDEDEDLMLTISGTGTIDTPLYLVDAVDGITTELSDDMSITVRSNEHGRYFITASIFTPDGEEEESVIRCYSPQPGTIVCTTSTGDYLQDVEIYTTSGMKVASAHDVDAISTTISVPSRSVYLVKATTERLSEGKAVKVAVQ